MSVDASFVDQIWRPDVFFVDSREQNRHSVVTDNLLLDIKAQFHTLKYHHNRLATVKKALGLLKKLIETGKAKWYS